MKKLILTFSILLGLTLSTEAQDAYKTAGGVRAGWGLAATGKMFISDQGALELILNARPRLFSSAYSRATISLLYEHHESLAQDLEIPGLSYYFGGGGYIGRYGFFSDLDELDGGNTYIGILGVIGLDYAFEEYPINISVDWMPSLSFSGYGRGFSGEVGGLAIRYVFN